MADVPTLNETLEEVSIPGILKNTFVKREIQRSHLNKLDEFIADASDDVYRHLVDFSKEESARRRGLLCCYRG